MKSSLVFRLPNGHLKNMRIIAHQSNLSRIIKSRRLKVRIDGWCCQSHMFQPILLRCRQLGYFESNWRLDRKKRGQKRSFVCVEGRLKGMRRHVNEERHQLSKEMTGKEAIKPSGNQASHFPTKFNKKWPSYICGASI